MDRRIGVIAILVNDRENIPALNSIISNYNDLILGRMGLPLKDKNINVISLIVDGNTDQIGALTGKIGRLEGINVRSVLTQHKEEQLENPVVS